MKSYTINAENAWLYQSGFAQEGLPFAVDSCFYIVRIELKAGERHKGHAHHIDHVGNLVSGRARLEWRREDGSDEGVIHIDEPCKILVRADTWHRIVAVEPVVWECWFAKADADKLTSAEGRWSWMREKHG